MKTRTFVALSAGLLSTLAGANAGVSIPTASSNTVWAGSAIGSFTDVSGSQVVAGTYPLTYGTLNSGFYAHTVATISDSGFFLSEIDNRRSGSNDSQEHIHVTFSVDAPTTFTYSGNYTHVNSASNTGRAAIQNALTDITTSTSLIPTTFLFSDFNALTYTFPIQTVTGTLTPGHLYTWDLFVQSLKAGNQGVNDSSTATGAFSLALTTVPTPGSLAALAFGGVAILRRRRK
jgi:hypothetical protein